MVASHILITGLIAAVGASMHTETDNFATLLKRQEPGTPAYNCHDNCGTAITISKANDDVCSNEVFLFDYKNCLQCAGPDSYNIWRYYGRSLSSVAAKCGLDTEPLSGKQEEVPKAMHPGESSGGSSSSATPTPTPTASPTAAPEGETITESAPTTTEGNPSEGTSTVEVIPTGTGVVSGSPSAPTNGTGSYTSSTPSQFTGAAAAVRLSNAATVFGFAALGVAFGLGG